MSRGGEGIVEVTPRKQQMAIGSVALAGVCLSAQPEPHTVRLSDVNSFVICVTVVAFGLSRF